jgi:hypothetical protein
MQSFPQFSNHALTLFRKSTSTVQAGTPMTVTGNGTSLRVSGRGVFIFCPEISSGVRGQTAPGGFSKRGPRS